MRSREEVLTEYNIERDEEDGCLILPQHRDTIINALAERISELESQLSAVVARETQRESGKSILRGIAAPEVYRG